MELVLKQGINPRNAADAASSTAQTAEKWSQAGSNGVAQFDNIRQWAYFAESKSYGSVTRPLNGTRFLTIEDSLAWARALSSTIMPSYSTKRNILADQADGGWQGGDEVEAGLTDSRAQPEGHLTPGCGRL
jgi:hypothetical protein